MKKIGLLSDTHGYWDDKYLYYFEPCDEIWHAGDIGSLDVARRLADFRPLRAVYGNIDGQDIRRLFPETDRFTVEGADVVMKHIGGYPGKYEKGKEITIGDTGDCSVYIAGAAEKDGKLVTSGGRVLSAVATASTLGEALSKAYKAMEHISFEGMDYRKDIGRRALEASDGV